MADQDDSTASRKSLPPFVDLAALSEDERITIIGEMVDKQQQTVAFAVETDAKADRYMRKLHAKYKVREISRHANVFTTRDVTVKVGPVLQ